MRAFRTLFALAIAAVGLSSPARSHAADSDIVQSNKATAAFQGGQFEQAATLFSVLADDAISEEIRLRSEYYVAESFFKAGYFDQAFRRYSYVIKAGPNHPYYLRAVEGVVTVSETLDEDFITGALLDKEYNNEFAKLPIETLNKINYIVGSVSYRKNKRDDALKFFEAIPTTSNYYARARYIIGLVQVQLATQSNQDESVALQDEAIQTFQELIDLKETKDLKYVGLSKIRQLSILAIARVNYGLGRFAESVKYYDAIPRFSEFWDEALAEAGWAKFQNEDFGGALGSLQALHAPQFAGSFQPESWILKATVYYESCLYADAKAALEGFDRIYLPINEKLKPLLEGDQANEFYYGLLLAKSTVLPRSVKAYLLGNERLAGFKKAIEQLDKEKRMAATSPLFKETPLGNEIIGGAEQTRDLEVQIIGSFVKRRLDDAQRMIVGFQGQSELIRFEVFKGEAEVLSQRSNQDGYLAAQPIYRPAMPGTNWEYWQFGGEFWLDEIGYYQYTLKNGCLAKKDE